MIDMNSLPIEFSKRMKLLLGEEFQEYEKALTRLKSQPRVL